MMEDKNVICLRLCFALQATRNCSDLTNLAYDYESETVTAEFADGGKRVINVAMDSGTAMIRDIMKILDVRKVI